MGHLRLGPRQDLVVAADRLAGHGSCPAAQKLPVARWVAEIGPTGATGLRCSAC